MDLLAFKVAEADKYTLMLMDALFTEEELAGSCYQTTKRSTKPPLLKEKREFLEGQKLYLFILFIQKLTTLLQVVLTPNLGQEQWTNTFK